jgi:hypothetical protein
MAPTQLTEAGISFLASSWVTRNGPDIWNPQPVSPEGGNEDRD